jgi:hypothetical protein
VALSILEEGGEGAALLLSLQRCVEGRKRVLMLSSLALRRHRREAACHILLEEALLSRRHRSPHRFDVAAMGIGVGGNMHLRQPSRCRPSLGGHELMRQLVAALCLERH